MSSLMARGVSSASSATNAAAAGSRSRSSLRDPEPPPLRSRPLGELLTERVGDREGWSLVCERGGERGGERAPGERREKCSVAPRASGEAALSGSAVAVQIHTRLCR